jgi:hypothetical protein
MYSQCPKMYYERYECADLSGVSSVGPTESVGTNEASTTSIPANLRGIELSSRDRTSLEFGSRFHQLVEQQRLGYLSRPVPEYPEVPDSRIESECQATFAAYEAHYLPEPLRFLEAEKVHVLKLPLSETGTQHELAVKLDAVVRHADTTIGPLDTKTEGATSQNNTRESWAGRTQASLYLWALKQLYPNETVSRLVVDVVTRGTSKRGPVFRRMDDIDRPQGALDEAIKNVVAVCEDIELARRTGFWRSNMNICKDGWKRCDYYDLHVIGRTEANLRKFQPAEDYLGL